MKPADPGSTPPPDSERLLASAFDHASIGDFGLETIAEGVEDQATLDLLREMGVDLAQGLWIGRRMPIRELWPTAPDAMERI